MRLIDADKLKRHYSWWKDETKETVDTIVDLQPTVDAIEVVRCKDCKYYGTTIGGKFVPVCKKLEYTARTENDYCSRGERREDGTC